MDLRASKKKRKCCFKCRSVWRGRSKHRTLASLGKLADLRITMRAHKRRAPKLNIFLTSVWSSCSDSFFFTDCSLLVVTVQRWIQHLRGHSKNSWHSKGWGAGSTKCHLHFFCFLNTDLETFRSKKLSLRDLDQALKDTFFLIHLKLQCHKS